jgi:poly(A) polymerase
MRPDLDGDQIMRILDILPGRVVGEARAFLMELRLDEGPLGEVEAEKRLRAWAAKRELS